MGDLQTKCLWIASAQGTQSVWALCVGSMAGSRQALKQPCGRLVKGEEIGGVSNGWGRASSELAPCIRPPKLTGSLS